MISTKKQEKRGVWHGLTEEFSNHVQIHLPPCSYQLLRSSFPWNGCADIPENLHAYSCYELVNEQASGARTINNELNLREAGLLNHISTSDCGERMGIGL
jgi:hypothetical protein